jgi:hypothetical protein
MSHDFSLLLYSVPAKGAPGTNSVAVPAKRMPHQQEIEAPSFLRLPDVRQFVNEKSLAA